MTKKWQKKAEIFFSQQKSGINALSGSGYSVLAINVLNVYCRAGKTLVVPVPDTACADRLTAEIRELAGIFGISPRLLCVPECARGHLLFPGGESRRARALDGVLNREYDLVIGSINSLLGPAQAPQEVRSAALVLKSGLEISPGELLEKLVALDYDDEYEASVSGEFARRGGIIDLFSPAHDAPCRVEFFGDTIDTLRLYNPATQRSTGNTAEYRVIGRSGMTAGGIKG